MPQNREIDLSLQTKPDPMRKIAFILSILMLVALASCENPTKSRIYMDEGVDLMYRYSKYQEAEEAFTKAIGYDKSNYEAYFHRGCAKVNAQKYKEAIKDFQKAVELKPDYADAYFNMGKTYYIMNDLDKSCEYYKLAAQYGRPNLEDYLKRCN